MLKSSKVTLGILFSVIALGLTTWSLGHIKFSSALLKPLPQAQTNQSASTLPQIDPALTGAVLDASKEVPGVKDSTAVVLDQDISLAIQVSGFDRLSLEKIKQSVYQKAAAAAPGYEVHVTSDKKLFFMLQRLEQQLQPGHNISHQDLKARLDWINEQMKG